MLLVGSAAESKALNASHIRGSIGLINMSVTESEKMRIQKDSLYKPVLSVSCFCCSSSVTDVNNNKSIYFICSSVTFLLLANCLIA